MACLILPALSKPQHIPIAMITERKASEMIWRTVSSSAANKLLFLRFDHLTSAHWIGYVNADGICERPQKDELSADGLAGGAYRHLRRR